MKPKWYREKKKSALKRLYLSVLPTIRRVARESGYAIGVHGSMRRDFDLIAVPWVERPKSSTILAHRLTKALCGFQHTKLEWFRKPNGRIAVLLFFGMNAHLDLSIVGEGVRAGIEKPVAASPRKEE